jgi:hypothetical protein
MASPQQPRRRLQLRETRSMVNTQRRPALAQHAVLGKRASGVALMVVVMQQQSRAHMPGVCGTVMDPAQRLPTGLPTSGRRTKH